MLRREECFEKSKTSEENTLNTSPHCLQFHTTAAFQFATLRAVTQARAPGASKFHSQLNCQLHLAAQVIPLTNREPTQPYQREELQISPITRVRSGISTAWSPVDDNKGMKEREKEREGGLS